jgi:hypothetical protein
MELAGAWLECGTCGAEYEGAWSADVADLQQLEEPPQADQVCPAGHVNKDVTYPRWSFFTEAG